MDIQQEKVTLLRLLDTYALEIAKHLQLLDVQACNSANKAAFQNPTKIFCRILKRLFISGITGQNVQRWQK